MTKMILSVPVVRVDKRSRWEEKGSLEVSGDFDLLTEGYSALKAELNELLQQANAEIRLLTDLKQVHDEISAAETKLRDLQFDIKRAETYKARLLTFLGRLGIDGREYMEALYIDNRPLLEGEARPSDDEDEE